MTNIENKLFECRKIGEEVTLELVYSSIPSAIKILSSFNCKKACIECGVVSVTNLSKQYNWGACPAYKVFT